MIAIRAHFDGRVIVPDEPVELTANSPLIVMVDDAAPSKTDIEMEEEIRRYYQERSAAEAAEDDEWGAGVAKDSHKAWE